MNKYFYYINYPSYEEELSNMEMKTFFGALPGGKYFTANEYVNPSRSPYIKEMIDIIYEEDTLDQIVNKVKKNNLSYDGFKMIYIKTPNSDVSYEERLKAMKDVGFVVNGEPDIANPKIRLGITKFNGKWIFGKYIKNDYEWHIHDSKPCSYSNSLSIRVARAIVNIAVGNKSNIRVVDPCCGVGTVVIEGLSMGVDIRGYDINNSVVLSAKRNLEFFAYEDKISQKDIQDINEKFDVAIIDIPYGLFTPTTIEEQSKIINSARKIANKLILVAFENMDSLILDAGFNIIDSAIVCKGSFKRYIEICE